MTPRHVVAPAARADCRPLRAVALALVVAVAWSVALAESGPGWGELSPAQRQALSPLRNSWATIDQVRKQKWLELAGRFQAMPADERNRVQQRMADWAGMNSVQRATARVQFQETRQIDARERQQRWETYRALPVEERRRLALSAAQTPKARPARTASVPAQTRTTPEPAAKRNVVAAKPPPLSRPVTPTVVQAKPGATTTTVAQPAKPPLHHQAGLPKIVATPGFVDPATLLPRRGPQGAAMRAVAAGKATSQP